MSKHVLPVAAAAVAVFAALIVVVAAVVVVVAQEARVCPTQLESKRNRLKPFDANTIMDPVLWRYTLR